MENELKQFEKYLPGHATSEIASGSKLDAAVKAKINSLFKPLCTNDTKHHLRKNLNRV